MPFMAGLPKALRDADVAVVLEPGWETRGNPHFEPLGVVCHHTGPGSNEALVRLCINGRSDLAGPLANVVLTTDGVAHVIAAGRANHAGTGGWQGLEGNSQVFGIEAVHPGDRLTPWPVVQVEAYEKICAGMARYRGFGAEYACGHKEWAPTRKIDPIRIEMAAFRARVAARLTGAMGAPQPSTKVRPMYDPPLGPIAGVAQDDQGRVLCAVAPDGSVYAWGVPYSGGPAGKDYFAGRRAAGISLAADGKGYIVTATSAETYGPSF
jgi:N-acetylmuramoyl-L-alanine amidase